MSKEARAELRRYWRRDVPLCLLIAFPVVFAFDQSLRFGLLQGWVSPNLLTAFILRPALVYLAGRSVLRWLRVDWRGFGFLVGQFIAFDAKSFKVPLEHAVIASVLTGMALFILEIFLEYGPDPSKRSQPSKA